MSGGDGNCGDAQPAPLTGVVMPSLTLLGFELDFTLGLLADRR